MVFNRFRINLIFRVLLLSATIFLFLYLLEETHFTMLPFLVALIIIFEVYSLIVFAERTNRELIRFLDSVEHADFTQTVSIRHLGPSFGELADAFGRVTDRFLELRSEKEENFRYLQTVVQHVGIGVITFKSDGEVEILNNAAKRLLNVNQLKNIKLLEKFSGSLTRTLLHLKPGENALVKIGENEKLLHLAINATEFKLHGELYTLVSLQDIQSEIERERLSRELEIARQVQNSLLPKSDPQVDGYDIASVCLPAEEVGGDYYDFLSVGENRLGMLIGDVSGKGVPAAFYMTLTKGMIQSNCINHISPRDVLIKVNHLLYRTMERGSFVSLFFALLDAASRTIVCSRAGHNPALHYSAADDEVRMIRPAGIGLGLEEGKIFEEVIQTETIHLRPGDWFIFYTDGFTEAMNRNLQEYGEERLTQVIRANSSKTAGQMIDAVCSAIEDFIADAPPHDDMTMIALKVR